MTFLLLTMILPDRFAKLLGEIEKKGVFLNPDDVSLVFTTNGGNETVIVLKNCYEIRVDDKGDAVYVVDQDGYVRRAEVKKR